MSRHGLPGHQPDGDNVPLCGHHGVPAAAPHLHADHGVRAGDKLHLARQGGVDVAVLGVGARAGLVASVCGAESAARGPGTTSSATILVCPGLS